MSGRLPFEASSLPAVLVRQATESALPLSSVAPGVAAQLGAAIDRCLATRREARFDTGRAVANALEPRRDLLPAMPIALRKWLLARNPAQPVIIGVYALAGITLIQFGLRMMVAHRPFLSELGLPALLMIVPLVPILGYHITQARRLFRAGYSLADLRSAIAFDVAERRDAIACEVMAPLSLWQRYLQIVSYGSIAQSLLTTVLTASGISYFPTTMIGASYLGAFAALGLANAFGVPLLPATLRRGPRGLRDRLWNSRFGSWIAKRMHAPMTSAPIGGAIFRATEAALGVAASELFAALPAPYREQLADLPIIVQTLQARAAESRAQLNALQGMAVAGGHLALPLADAGEQRMRRSLGESVGALESIRLDLLRLHAGEADLAPITTLLDAAKSIGVDVERLIVAQREAGTVARRVGRRTGFAHTPTPA